MHNGKLHRWARDSSDHGRHGTAGGSRLHLFRIETLSGEDYWESYQLSIEPTNRGGAGGGGSHAGVAGADNSSGTSGGGNGEVGGGNGEEGESGDGGWAAGRLHHVDVQPVITEPHGSSKDAAAAANSSWLGLIDGDEFADGGQGRHFLGPDGGWRLVRAKRVLLQLVLAQVGGIRVNRMKGPGRGEAESWALCMLGRGTRQG